MSETNKQPAPRGSLTLDAPATVPADPAAQAQHAAAVGRLGGYIVETLAEAGGEVRYYALQPEQIVALRARLQAVGIHNLADIQLPPRPVDQGGPARAAYLRRRQLLAHLQRVAARWPHDADPGSLGGRPAALRWPGEQIAQVLRQEDARLVAIGRRICEFNEIFTTGEPTT